MALFVLCTTENESVSAGGKLILNAGRRSARSREADGSSPD